MYARAGAGYFIMIPAPTTFQILAPVPAKICPAPVFRLRSPVAENLYKINILQCPLNLVCSSFYRNREKKNKTTDCHKLLPSYFHTENHM